MRTLARLLRRLQQTSVVCEVLELCARRARAGANAKHVREMHGRPPSAGFGSDLFWLNAGAGSPHVAAAMSQPRARTPVLSAGRSATGSSRLSSGALGAMGTPSSFLAISPSSSLSPRPGAARATHTPPAGLTASPAATAHSTSAHAWRAALSSSPALISCTRHSSSASSSSASPRAVIDLGSPSSGPRTARDATSVRFSAAPQATTVDAVATVGDDEGAPSASHEAFLPFDARDRLRQLDEQFFTPSASPQRGRDVPPRTAGAAEPAAAAAASAVGVAAHPLSAHSPQQQRVPPSSVALTVLGTRDVVERRAAPSPTRGAAPSVASLRAAGFADSTQRLIVSLCAAIAQGHDAAAKSAASSSQVVAELSAGVTGVEAQIARMNESVASWRATLEQAARLRRETTPVGFRDAAA